jgi:hypothetical protein
MVGKKPTGFVGNRRDLSVGVFPQRYCKYCTTCWHFPCKGKESKYGWQASRLNSSEKRRDLSVGVFPQRYCKYCTTCWYFPCKGKESKYGWQKADWIRRKLTGLVDLGVSPTLLEVEHNGLGIFLVKGQRVSMVGKQANWICRFGCSPIGGC